MITIVNGDNDDANETMVVILIHVKSSSFFRGATTLWWGVKAPPTLENHLTTCYWNHWGPSFLGRWFVYAAHLPGVSISSDK